MTEKEKKIYELKAQVIAAAGNPIRLAIIEYLGNEAKCVSELAELVDAERSNVSRHLAVLLKAGIVTQRKKGVKIIYSLQTPCLLKFVHCIEEVVKKRVSEENAIIQQM